MDPDLMALLVCPACRGPVQEQDSVIVCQSCGKQYPVREGIPVMLVEEAS
ncbi:MAG: Trm112 family protein [Candidatus Omnitrophica bacterium]|nr:Trm112 family protein [Candidatus Omnitrophota bacterium]